MDVRSDSVKGSFLDLMNGTRKMQFCQSQNITGYKFVSVKKEKEKKESLQLSKRAPAFHTEGSSLEPQHLQSKGIKSHLLLRPWKATVRK